MSERWHKLRELPKDIGPRLERLPSFLAQKGVLLAYLFGSLSRTYAGHDVDLAILTESTPAFRLRGDIVHCLGTERVDLVDLRRASPVLRLEILQTGRPLYIASEAERERFELESLRLYADTIPLRRQQRDYLKRRTVAWATRTAGMASAAGAKENGPMALKRESIEERLKELDEILQELSKYQAVSAEELRANLSQRWIIERGLIAAATLILDMANHILTGYFGHYAATYEETLLALRDEKVIAESLYQQLKGLGSFRNVLVHLYQAIDPQQVLDNYQKALSAFPLFSQAVLAWLDELGEEI
jgi:uncharacterized protein YutE (UPF0331/DUF86 family)/predicted nucleotidyltransferase